MYKRRLGDVEVKEDTLAAARLPAKMLHGFRGRCRAGSLIWKTDFHDVQCG
jgi:hypothetical protein